MRKKKLEINEFRITFKGEAVYDPNLNPKDEITKDNKNFQKVAERLLIKLRKDIQDFLNLEAPVYVDSAYSRDFKMSDEVDVEA